MGTNNLIAVIAGGSHRVAQFSRYDGQPEYAGLEVLDYLRGASLSLLCASALNCRFVDGGRQSQSPQMSGQIGALILPIIERAGGCDLEDHMDFGTQGACEWAYVVDLDRNRLEVHGKDHSGCGRFHDLAREMGCEQSANPVSILALFELDDLPDDEHFLGALGRAPHPDAG
ncbi:hypothetical protein [Tranquillimonas alkanivorans]|uniref:Uncharacterized protein n=1 Tax=Tranquillimonas alkanivorans TaxID=441119 RepID=A0A1I5TT74_9RHOB|nr:hypothetical protein [Tranquillimonas alkanivorans]SFP86254.1 hypothetical protein SAMN04488047_11515 [Tranquillimonas alkanivorans]